MRYLLERLETHSGNDKYSLTGMVWEGMMEGPPIVGKSFYFYSDKVFMDGVPHPELKGPWGTSKVTRIKPTVLGETMFNTKNSLYRLTEITQ